MVIAKLTDVRIQGSKQLITASALKGEFPLLGPAVATVEQGRRDVANVINGKDFRFMVVIGPCSIHDPKAAVEYATRLQLLREKYEDKLLILMRVYFEKPRTNVGWKGLLMTPGIVTEDNPNEGRRVAREIMVRINALGLPIATEFLNSYSWGFMDDVVSYGTVGARSVTNQDHRTMVSGLSCPVGLKNETSGDVNGAINAIITARARHTIIGPDDDGYESSFQTTGNPDTQLVLRGGDSGPNYLVDDVTTAVAKLRQHNLSLNLMVDCSHGNSAKDYREQAGVIDYVLQRRGETYPISGVMIESNLVAGRQDPAELRQLTYGQSITDACIDWKETEKLLAKIYQQL